MTCLQRIQAAIARIRTVLSNLRSNAEAEQLRTDLADAVAARDAAVAERDACTAAVEAFADQVDPPAVEEAQEQAEEQAEPPAEEQAEPPASE